MRQLFQRCAVVVNVNALELEEVKRFALLQHGGKQYDIGGIQPQCGAGGAVRALRTRRCQGCHPARNTGQSCPKFEQGV